MAQSPTHQDLLSDARMALADRDEAIKTHSRKVRSESESETPVCNLSEDAREIVGIEPGDTVDVHVFMGFVVIKPEE
ncbi:MAG: hypothetical protein ACOCUO_03245 [archaeon]